MHQLHVVGYNYDMEQFERISEYPLEQITAPTLVLHGDKDNNVPIKDAELVVSKIRHARLVIDEGGDHLFFITHREKIVPLLLEFLKEHSQSMISR
jgi:pimeloyl-ACP methyl ester carboxylesterase